MKILNIREVRASVGHLDDIVEQAGEVLVTRYGEPILRILPIKGKHQRPDHADLRQKMRYLKTPSQERIREDRDER